MRGDEHTGRGSSQRGLGRSPLCNSFTVSTNGGATAIRRFIEEIRADPKLLDHLPRLSGKRLVCHCLPTQACHADSIVAEYRLMFPRAYDREDAKGTVPTSAVLNRLAQLRLEPESDDDLSPDEDAPRKGAGRAGVGSPLLVGSRYTVRELCDGQSLAWPGRWAVEDRRYLEDRPSRVAHQSLPLSSASLVSPALFMQLRAPRGYLAKLLRLLHAQLWLLRLPAFPTSRPTLTAMGTPSSTLTASTRLPTSLQPPSPSRPTPLELVGALATSAAAACARLPSAPCGAKFERPCQASDATRPAHLLTCQGVSPSAFVLTCLKTTSGARSQHVT